MTSDTLPADLSDKSKPDEKAPANTIRLKTELGEVQVVGWLAFVVLIVFGFFLTKTSSKAAIQNNVYVGNGITPVVEPGSPTAAVSNPDKATPKKVPKPPAPAVPPTVEEAERLFNSGDRPAGVNMLQEIVDKPGPLAAERLESARNELVVFLLQFHDQAGLDDEARSDDLDRATKLCRENIKKFKPGSPFMAHAHVHLAVIAETRAQWHAKSDAAQHDAAKAATFFREASTWYGNAAALFKKLDQQDNAKQKKEKQLAMQKAAEEQERSS